MTDGPGPTMMEAVWGGLCPRCGQASIFGGFSTLTEECPACGLELGGNDTGDGPAFILITLLCLVSVPLILLAKAMFALPYWALAMLAGLLILLPTLLLMRPVKAYFVAMNYRHRTGL